MGNEGYQQENCRDRRARSRKAPNRGELSTCGEAPSASAKKREAEKRNSPCTPYREKGKGKETRRGSLQNRLSRAPAHGRKALCKALDADLDIAVRAFKGSQSDRRIWAAIAWRVGIENFHYALRDKLAEDMNEKAARRPSAAFQAFLNDRFPKNGGAA